MLRTKSVGQDMFALRGERFVLGSALHPAMPETLQIEHDFNRSVTVRDGDEVLFAYRYGDVDLFPYCHPVHLPGEHPVTMIRPGDHPWHYGIYFAWKYINGLNAWDQEGSGHPWATTRNLSLVIEDPGPDRVRLTNEIEWIQPGGEALMRDERRIAYTQSDDGTERWIDWELEFTPLVDLHLDRHVEWGGYAGMTVRFVRTVEPELLNSQGETTWPEAHRYRASWTDYTWWLDGISDLHNFQHWGGLTLMDHPTNLRHPTPWLTWTEKYMQGLNASILRDEPLDLKRGETLRLAYRHFIHPGKADPERIAAEYERFSAWTPFEDWG